MGNIGSIYVEVKGDITQFQKDMTQLRSIAKQAGGKVSDALNNSVMPGKASQGIRDISTNLKQLAQSAKVPGENFKITADAISKALKDMANKAGMTEKEFSALNEKMLKTQAWKTAETSMRNIARAADLSKAEIKALGVQMGYTGKQSRKMADNIKRSRTNVKSFASSMSSMKSTLIGVGLAITGVVYATKRMSEAIWDAGQRTLVAENAYKSITGSTAAANVQFGFLGDTAKELGLNFYTLREGYKGFLAAANSSTLPMKEIQKIFKSVSNAGAILGLSNEKMSLTFLALEQMLSKGKVSMEEIRRQMGDSLPGAFQLGAKAMGMTVEAFDKAVSAGKVYADDFLPKFSKAMDEMYIGTIADSVRAVNLLKESWEDLKVGMAEAGFMDSAAVAMANLTDKLKDPKVIASLKSWVGLLGDILVLTGSLAAFGADRIVAFTNFFKGIAAVNDHRLSFGDFLFASPEEMAAILAGFDQVDKGWESAQKSIRTNTMLTQDQITASIQKTQEAYDKLIIISASKSGVYSNVGMGFNPEAFKIPEADQKSLTAYTEKISELKRLLEGTTIMESWIASGYTTLYKYPEAVDAAMTALSNFTPWQDQLASLKEYEATVLKTIGKTDAIQLKLKEDFLKEYKKREDARLDVVQQVENEILKIKAKMGAKGLAEQKKRDAAALKVLEEQQKAIAQTNDELNKLTMTEQKYKLLKLKQEFDARAVAAGGYSDALQQVYDIQKSLIEQKFMDTPWDADYSTWESDEERIKREAEAVKKAYENRVQAEKDLTAAQIKENEQREKDLAKALDKQQEATEHMYNEIHDIAADFWGDALDGQINSWDDFMDHMLSTFKKTSAQILANATTPILMNIVQSVTGGITGGIGSSIGSSLLGSNSPGTSLLGNLSGVSDIFGASGQGVYADLFGVSSVFTNPAGVTGALGGAYGPTAGMAGGNVGLPGASGALASGGIAGMAVSAGAMALFGFVASKIVNEWGKSSPRIGFMGSEKDLWDFPANEKRDEQPYTTTLDFGGVQSENFDYQIFARHFEDGDDQIQDAMFEYFDSIFTRLDEATAGCINDVLKEYSHYGYQKRLDLDNPDFEGALNELSENVFDDYIGLLLKSILPDEGTVEKTFQAVVGNKSIDYATLTPSPFAPGSKDQWAMDQASASTGKDAFDAENARTYVTIPVYEDQTRQESAAVDTFNSAFFDALMPEGGNEWDSLFRFAETVDGVGDFMVQFTRQVEEFGESTLDAFLNVETITGILSEVDAAMALLAPPDMMTALNESIALWDTLTDALKDANASVEDMIYTERRRDRAIGSQISGLTGTSVHGMITGGTSISESLMNNLRGEFVAESMGGIMNRFINPLNRKLGEAEAEGGVQGAMAALPDILDDLDWEELPEYIAAIDDSFNEMVGIMEDAPEIIEDISNSFDFLRTKSELMVQLLEAQGKTEEALALQREHDLEDLRLAWGSASGPLEDLTQQIWTLEDTARDAEAAATELARITDERTTLEKELLQAQGDTEALRQLDLAAIDESNRALQKKIWALQDLEEAEREAQEALRVAEGNVVDAYRVFTNLLFDQEQKVRETQAAYVDALRDELNEKQLLRDDAKRSADAFKELGKNISGFHLGMLTGSNSPLGLGLQQNLAQNEFMDVASLARRGDADALANLNDAATTLLDTAMAAGPGYDEIFRLVQKEMNAADRAATRELSDAEKQIAKTDSQILLQQESIDKITGFEQKAIDELQESYRIETDMLTLMQKDNDVFQNIFAMESKQYDALMGLVDITTSQADAAALLKSAFSALSGSSLSFAGGGTVSGSESGYTTPVTFHGTEHIVTDDKMGTVAELLSDVKDLLVSIRDTGGDINKTSIKTYRVLERVTQGSNEIRTREIS